MSAPPNMAPGTEQAQFELPLAVFAQLIDQALLLVDPRIDAAVMASPKALSLLQPDEATPTLPVPLTTLFEPDDGLAERMSLALATSQPISFGLRIRAGGQRIGAKAQRFDQGGDAPLVLVQCDAEPELLRRFRELRAQILMLNREIEQRRAAEHGQSLTTAALRRSLDVVRALSEIGTMEGEHLALATEVVASSLGASGAAMVVLSGSHLFYKAQTGTGLGRIDEAKPLELSTGRLRSAWSAQPADRDKMLIAALERAAETVIDASCARVIPVTVADEPVAALVAVFATPEPASGLGDLEAGIVAEALGSLLVRADIEERLIHGQKLEAIGRLTGGIAHDFNNILAVVLGNAELMLDEMTHGEDELARAIQDAAQRGAILTSRLLSFARKQPLRPGSTDINALLRDIDPMIRRTLGAEIDVQLVTAGGLWNAEIDQSQLETALLNLAINSRDAMPDGGRLTIETGNSSLDADYAAQHDEVVPGQYVMVAVSDTGAGMDAATAEQAFMPFFTTKGVGKGSGLGLSMVFGFVKQSGGHVKIYTEPGRGTTVRMYLPRVPAGQTQASRSGDFMPDAPPEGRGRILLVEDDPAVLRFTARTLAALGYDVDPVLDGVEAIALLDRNSYALLLTDVVLPGKINGRIVAEHARAVAPGTAVLFMSGYTENAIVHHGRLDADAELISKPFTRNQLAMKLKELIG
jgi:signal transduction histidine kinase